LERWKVRKVFGKLKDGKAMGMDEMPNEAWKYGGEEIERWIWRLCNRVWKGRVARGMEEYIYIVIVPIVKKGRGKRGITEDKGLQRSNLNADDIQGLYICVDRKV